jgi:hypothetical protein
MTRVVYSPPMEILLDMHHYLQRCVLLSRIDDHSLRDFLHQKTVDEHCLSVYSEVKEDITTRKEVLSQFGENVKIITASLKEVSSVSTLFIICSLYHERIPSKAGEVNSVLDKTTLSEVGEFIKENDERDNETRHTFTSLGRR